MFCSLKTFLFKFYNFGKMEKLYYSSIKKSKNKIELIMVRHYKKKNNA